MFSLSGLLALLIGSTLLMGSWAGTNTDFVSDRAESDLLKTEKSTSGTGRSISGGPVSNADTLPSSEAYAKQLRSGGTPDWPADVQSRVDSVLSKMTLEEKVGQMTQLEIGMVTSGEYPEEIDTEKLKKAVQEYHVGSILNVGAGAYSLDHWHEIIHSIQDAAEKTRLGIPVIYGIDAVHGANYTRESVLFPQQLGMGSTWNPHLMEKAAAITARDVRASGIPWNFSPVLDVGREPVWPRLYETFSEDPYHSNVFGLTTLRGYQGTDVSDHDKVAATLKHFIGYSGPDTGMDRTPARLTESELREKFLPPFRQAVNAGALSIMINSGEVNGVPAHSSEYLLTDLLRDELGFKGLVVSDWRDIKKLVDFHHSAATEREATKRAVMAGVDMSMVPSDYSFYNHLLDLVQDGEVPEARINEAVRRILAVKFALGLFEDPTAGMELADEVGSEEDREVALQAAQESITLLRNEDDLLPLSGDESVLVTGPTANSMQSLHNGWTYTWQGRGLADEMFPDRPTIVEAVRNEAGSDQVRHVPGTTLDEVEDIDAAVSAANKSDVVLMSLGEGAYAETPGNIGSLELPDVQQELLERVSDETETPIALLLVEGRPRVIGDSAWAPEALAVAYNPGQEGGKAIADVLYGNVNPSGHLSTTYPRVPVGAVPYDHTYSVGEGQQSEVMQGQADAIGPLFEFGDGLSYTTFEYSDLTVSDTSWTTDAVAQGDSLGVSVTIENTGERAGKDVVQLYLRDHVATLTPSVKELRRFAKVDLEPRESQTLRFKLGRKDLGFIDHQGRSIVEPGRFSIAVDTLEQQVMVEGERLSSEVAPALRSSE